MIKDSGERRKFDTGAVRDIADDKGRCDLLPLGVLAAMRNDHILFYINEFVRYGNPEKIVEALRYFCDRAYESDEIRMILEVSVHYSEGAQKYTERNWEKGIPLHCYVDSGVRHYLKWAHGDDDERHDRAFVWNMLGLLWTLRNKPEMNDLPWKEGDK